MSTYHRAALAATLTAALLAGCAQTPPAATASRDTVLEARNKQLVLDFYQQLFGDKDLGAIERYVAEGYIQHNPAVPTGRAALRAFAERVLANAPPSRADVRRAAAEGDLVWLHTRNPTAAQGKPAAIVDIFRVQDDRIVEHWDVIQPVPETAANTNTMF